MLGETRSAAQQDIDEIGLQYPWEIQHQNAEMPCTYSLRRTHNMFPPANVSGPPLNALLAAHRSVVARRAAT